MDRLFLDANVLYSAADRPEAGLRRLWQLTEVRLLTSAYAVEEANRNLESQEQRRRLADLLTGVTILPEAEKRLLPKGVKLPAKDRPILLAAIAGQATHLLTGDVKHFGPYYGQTVENVCILPPADYPPTPTHPLRPKK